MMPEKDAAPLGPPKQGAMRVPSAGAVEAGWSNLGIGVKAEDRVHGAAAEPSDLDIAHRRGALRGATANSRGSFTSVRKAITSRARTVSSRATGHVLERDRLEVIIAAAGLEDDFLKTLNVNRNRFQQWFGLGKAHAHCVVKLTDVAWGERTYKTKRLLADKDMEWPTPPHFDFVRLEGMHDPMLFTLDLILREKKSFLRSSTVTHVGSVTIDVKDESVGHDEEPQWHQLLTVEGVNSPGMVLLQIVKGTMGIEEIMALRRRKQMTIALGILIFTTALTLLLYFLLRPRFCNAACRGDWRSEAGMSVARADLAVTVFKDRIFAVGGRNLLTMESLDSKSGQWLAETSMTETRGRFGAAVSGEFLLAVGGVGRQTVEALNGSTSTPYRILPEMMADVQTVKLKESLCVVGRVGGTGVVPPSLGKSLVYSLNLYCMKGTNSTWNYRASVPTDRLKFALTNYAGRMLVIGGWLDGPSAVVEAYDGSTWQRLPDMLVPRYAAAAAQMSNRLYVTGGSDGYSTLRTLESFDGEKWREELELFTGRQQHAAIFFEGRLWVLGGVQIARSNVTALKTVESFVLNHEDEFLKVV